MKPFLLWLGDAPSPPPGQILVVVGNQGQWNPGHGFAGEASSCLFLSPERAWNESEPGWRSVLGGIPFDRPINGFFEASVFVARRPLARLVGVEWPPVFPSGHAGRGGVFLFPDVRGILSKRLSPCASRSTWDPRLWVALIVASSHPLLPCHWFTDIVAGGAAVGFIWLTHDRLAIIQLLGKC